MSVAGQLLSPVFSVFFSGRKWVTALLKGLSCWGLQLLIDEAS